VTSFIAVFHPLTGTVLCHFKVPRACGLSVDALRVVECGTGVLLVVSTRDALYVWPIGCGADQEVVVGDTACAGKVKKQRCGTRERGKKTRFINAPSF
jgi:hypothetical protein